MDQKFTKLENVAKVGDASSFQSVGEFDIFWGALFAREKVASWK